MFKLGDKQQINLSFNTVRISHLWNEAGHKFDIIWHCHEKGKNVSFGARGYYDHTAQRKAQKYSTIQQQEINLIEPGMN